MANYTYGCPGCGNKQDISHSIKEDPAIKCPRCKTLMRRLPPKRVLAVQNPWDAVFHRHLDPGWRNYRTKYNKTRRKKDEAVARAKRQRKLEERERAPKVIPIKRSMKHG